MHGMVALSAERHLVDPARYRYGGSATGLIASAIIVNPEMQVDGICRRLVNQPQITPKRLPLNPARPRNLRSEPQSHVFCNRDLHEVVKAEP